MKINEISENISHTSKRIHDIEKEKGVKPGTPEWFKLWFSLPYLKEAKENVAEGYKLQLERDTNMMVLHITDTKTGKRTEVRGKSGYENNGYDANDKLHQLLDKIGKSANVSELINGEIVTINPKHPHGTSAKAATDVAFNESLDTPYPYQWQKQDEDHYVAKADTPAGLMLIMFEWMQGDESWNIDFAVNGRMGKSGAGDEFSIFATVIAVIRDWVSKVDLSTVKLISFSADKSGDAGTSRTKLYTRFAKQMASQLGWRLEVNTRDTVDDFFKMHNPDVQVKEADDTLTLPKISVGDEVLVGKFKNRKATVKGFDKDDNNQPVLKTNKGDQKLFKPRISKLMVDESVNYVKPQFDVEWEEANRYNYFDKLGQAGWEELASKGKVVKVNTNSVKKIGNTGADGSESLDDLEPDKVARLKKAMTTGTVEMPIVVKQPNGSLDLVAGNTRLIGLISTQGEANVWLVDASKLTEDENF